MRSAEERTAAPIPGGGPASPKHPDGIRQPIRGAADTLSKVLPDSLQAIQLVAARLGSLIDRVVFLGGAVAGLLVTDPDASTPRPTRDVDIVVTVAWLEYHAEGGLRAQLLERGFREVLDEGVICRWSVEGVSVDIMDATGQLFGFTNRWYRSSFAEARDHDIGDGLMIRLISPACFLATKLAAFADRGDGDFQASHDIEDIVSVVNGRAMIEEDVRSSPPDVRSYVAIELQRLLATPAFVEALAGHLSGDAASQEEVTRVLERLHKLASLR